LLTATNVDDAPVPAALNEVTLARSPIFVGTPAATLNTPVDVATQAVAGSAGSSANAVGAAPSAIAAHVAPPSVLCHTRAAPMPASTLW
jgi:hypothetical protein